MENSFSHQIKLCRSSRVLPFALSNSPFVQWLVMLRYAIIDGSKITKPFRGCGTSCVDGRRLVRTRTQSTILSHAHFLPNSISWVIANNEPSTLPDWVSPVCLSARSRMLLLYRCALILMLMMNMSPRSTVLLLTPVDWMSRVFGPSIRTFVFIYRVNQSIQIAERAGGAGTRSLQDYILHSSRVRSLTGVVNPTNLSTLLVQGARHIVYSLAHYTDGLFIHTLLFIIDCLAE